MKNYSVLSAVLLIFLLIFYFSSCEKKEPHDEHTGMTGKEEAAPTTVTFSVPELNEDYWQTLQLLQDSIKTSPGDTLLKKKYCQLGYIGDHRAIVAVGIGRLIHPETGRRIPEAMARQAAISDASRWAAYLISWIEEGVQKEFGSISRAVPTSSQIVNEIQQGDSLIVEMAFEYSRP